MTEIQGKSILVRVSEGSSYPESTVKGFQLTLHKLSVASLLDGPWADLWPFFAWLYFKRFSLYIGSIVDPSGGSVGQLRWSSQPW